MLRLATTLLAAVLVLSGGHLLTGPLAFEDHAARAVWTWRTSGAADIWREGFVPLEDLAAIPPRVVERIRQDEEYGWVVAGPLPATPPETQIRWDDGATMRAPVIGAREALLTVSPWGTETNFPEDETYHLTGATFTTMRLKTLRGMATVPAWRLYFSDLPGPIDQVAVDQEAVGTIEGAVGSLIGDVRAVEALDERTLLVSYEYGSCTGKPRDVRLRVREEPDVVVLGFDVHGPRQLGFCAGVGMSGQGVIELDEPLGARVLLDAKSRVPVLCRHVPNACRAGNG
ncbi:hypothetical protein ACIBF7_42330 [Nonomuraea sp. NPDC050478]|uniref:hypothetical protein n=1 Tax=Nonomuraea sp. NPDC050478 TaxID=3364365 RepID=UPI0037A45A46